MNKKNKHSLLIDDLLELEEEAVLSQVKERLQSGEDPFEIIEDAQQAMRLVGERYEQGNYYISSMMMAGEIFREVIEIVEPVLIQKTTGASSGVILLGTVKGDIHDIGKNIFEILLRSHGFSITDLGVDIEPDKIVEKAIEIKPDIIALSGLLTISYDSMKETIQKIRSLDNKLYSEIPFIIGGGTINEMVCSFVGAEYWAIDAMVGVQLCEQIMKEKK
ncbi:MAG: cobalamin-dependent protein [Anaerolineaceae bacterium]|nr:cobalamin-dependent protein [Anaerolineaceae bacterium]